MRDLQHNENGDSGKEVTTAIKFSERGDRRRRCAALPVDIDFLRWLARVFSQKASPKDALIPRGSVTQPDSQPVFLS